MKELGVFVGLLGANFLVASMFHGGDWQRALEVSYFQGLALFTYWLCRKIDHE